MFQCIIPQYHVNQLEFLGLFFFLSFFFYDLIHSIYSGNLVVSMRPLSSRDAIRAVELTSRFPRVHGSPIHIGDPVLIFFI